MRVGFSESSVYWTSKGADKRFFPQQILKNAVYVLIKNGFSQLVILFLNKTLAFQ